MTSLQDYADSDLAGYHYAYDAGEPAVSAAAFFGLVLCYGYAPVSKANMAVVASDIALSSSSFQYNGKSHVPTVSVFVCGSPLVDGQDYVAERDRGTEVGTYAVCVSGTGSYAGESTIYYTVTPAKVTNVKLDPYKGGIINVRWTDKLGKAAGVTKYRITVKCGKRIVAQDTIKAKRAKTKQATAKYYPIQVASSKYTGKTMKVTVEAIKGSIASPASAVKKTTLR